MGVLGGKQILQTVTTMSNVPPFIYAVTNNSTDNMIMGRSLCLVDFTGLAHYIKVNYYNALEYYNNIQPFDDNPYNLPIYNDLYDFIMTKREEWYNIDFSRKYIFDDNNPNDKLFLTPFLDLVMYNIFEKLRISIRERSINQGDRVILFIDKGSIGIKEHERIKRRKRKSKITIPANICINDILKFIHDKIPIASLMSYIITDRHIQKMCVCLKVTGISLAEFSNNEADIDMNRFANCINNYYVTDKIIKDKLLINQNQELRVKTIKTYSSGVEGHGTLSWLKYIENSTPIDNVVFIGRDIDMPFFFLIGQAYTGMMKTRHDSPLKFYVIQLIPRFTDPITKMRCDTLQYELNRCLLNGIGAMSIMLLAGSDYAEGCFSTNNTLHFHNFLQDIVYRSKHICICMDNIDPNKREQRDTCSKCGHSVDREMMTRTFSLLNTMSENPIGNMPKFDICQWQEAGSNDDERLWAIPFVSIALITAYIISTGIHNTLRSKMGLFTKRKPPINSEYLYIWLELLYCIFSYINCSSNYLSLLDKLPIAHVKNIRTKELLYHTAMCLTHQDAH